MFALNRKYIALIILLHTASSLAMISHLELFLGAGPVAVTLPFKYSSVSDDEKTRLKRINEGCMTLLEDEGDCALVGPVSPCQLMVLHNGGKTVVGHLCVNANQQSFIDCAKRKFSACSLAKTVGTLCTVHNTGYEEPYDTINGVPISFKDAYQGRSQIEELKYIKDAMIAQFGINDRNQIRAFKFTGVAATAATAIRYELAEKYVFIKHHVGHQPTLHSTCPIEENLFGDFRSLPVIDRYRACTYVKRVEKSMNPFFTQIKTEEEAFTYGKFSMIEIR